MDLSLKRATATNNWERYEQLEQEYITTQAEMKEVGAQLQGERASVVVPSLARLKRPAEEISAWATSSSSSSPLTDPSLSLAKE